MHLGGAEDFGGGAAGFGYAWHGEVGILSLRGIIAGHKLYRGLVTEYIHYREIEAELLELRERYAELAKKSKSHST